MKEIYNGNYIQMIPNNLPQEQEVFWENEGIHYEIQRDQFHFDIEKHFEYKNALKLILKTAFRKEIENGEIAVNDASWRTRYTFTKFPVTNNPSKMLDLIEEEYNIVSYVTAILIASANTRSINKTISTITPTASTFSKSFKTIEDAQANNRLLKTTALNNKYFTAAEFKTFRTACSTYADKHQDVYPKHSDKRAWFVAEQVYNFINSKGTYNLPSANSIQTLKSKINSVIKPNETIMEKVKKHYGTNYTQQIYSKEYTYQLKHNGKFTWEDPNYNAYVNRNELVKKIEDTNRPVREYIKNNMKDEWMDFEYHRKKDCANINNADKLAYAKYCSDYIKKLIHNNKIPSTVSKNWKHWSAIK